MLRAARLFLLLRQLTLDRLLGLHLPRDLGEQRVVFVHHESQL